MTVRIFCLLICFLLPSTVSHGTQPPVTITQVAASLHVLVLLSDGSVLGWGENRAGQLAVADVMTIDAPRRIGLPRKVISIATGTDASYAVLDDGNVMAWGRGYEGQLGTLADEAHMLRVPSPQRVRGLSGVRQVVAEDTSALALLEDGSVMAWGGRQTTMYVNGEYRADAFEPTPVKSLPPVVELAFNGSTALARTTDGRVFGWGSNRYGQLGLGITSDELVTMPVEIPRLRGALSVVVGAAVMPDGSVLTWGSNLHGGLGNGQVGDTGDAPQLEALPVKGVTGAVMVKRGSFGRHVMVLLKNGTLIGWGNSDWGQLGAGISGAFQPKPTPVRLNNIDRFWLGGNFSFARTGDGKLWFWGERSGVRAILGSVANQKRPAQLPLDKYLSPAGSTR